MSDPNYEKPKTEPIDVVMIKRDMNPSAAKMEDFQRVKVMATDTIAARCAPEVGAMEEKGFLVLEATQPGYETAAEMQARQREYAGNVTPREKIGFDDPIGAMPPYKHQGP